VGPSDGKTNGWWSAAAAAAMTAMATMPFTIANRPMTAIEEYRLVSAGIRNRSPMP
jgi:hypothetical protein